MVKVELYKSVLKKLSQIPIDYLQAVDNFLSSLSMKIEKKQQNRNAILALAGSWSDLSDEDFEDYRRATKETGEDLFNREVEL